MNTEFQDMYFDAVIDKACFDAILCGDSELGEEKNSA